MQASWDIALVSLILNEFGDSRMMRRMRFGIKRRAEAPFDGSCR